MVRRGRNRECPALQALSVKAPSAAPVELELGSGSISSTTGSGSVPSKLRHTVPLDDSGRVAATVRLCAPRPIWVLDHTTPPTGLSSSIPHVYSNAPCQKSDHSDPPLRRRHRFSSPQSGATSPLPVPATFDVWAAPPGDNVECQISKIKMVILSFGLAIEITSPFAPVLINLLYTTVI